MHRTDRPQLTLIAGGGSGRPTAGGRPGPYPRSTVEPRIKRSRRNKGAVPPVEQKPAEHEGGTDDQVGDRTGPGVGYDTNPEQVKDKGGVV
jgi:hypothetical protein